MKAWLVVLLACKETAQTAVPAVPIVASFEVLAKPEEAPPPLMMLDERGGVQLATAKTWAELDANALTLAERAPPIRAAAPRTSRSLDSPARRNATAVMVVRSGAIETPRAMIMVAPTTKALVLIEALRESKAAIAVANGGQIRPLHVQHDDRDPSAWLEARVSAKGITIEAVPDMPVETTTLEQLPAALDTARTARRYAADAPVDVLVDPEVDAQRLLDVVVALDTAGVSIIGMGGPLSPAELALRGRRNPAVRIGQPNAQGDLPKAEIRKVVALAAPDLTRCYMTAYATEPTLRGTVAVQFFIAPNGLVATASASGIKAEVAACMADVFKKLVFPKPQGGGGVQVNYPVTAHD